MTGMIKFSGEVSMMPEEKLHIIKSGSKNYAYAPMESPIKVIHIDEYDEKKGIFTSGLDVCIAFTLIARNEESKVQSISMVHLPGGINEEYIEEAMKQMEALLPTEIAELKNYEFIIGANSQRVRVEDLTNSLECLQDKYPEAKTEVYRGHGNNINEGNFSFAVNLEGEYGDFYYCNAAAISESSASPSNTLIQNYSPDELAEDLREARGTRNKTTWSNLKTLLKTKLREFSTEGYSDEVKISVINDYMTAARLHYNQVKSGDYGPSKLSQFFARGKTSSELALENLLQNMTKMMSNNSSPT